MKKLNRKAPVLWILAAVLCLSACVPAYASSGRIVYQGQGGDEESLGPIENVFRVGDGFCVVCNEDMATKLLKYEDAHAEPETFVFMEADDGGYSRTEADSVNPADADGDDDPDEEDESFLLNAGGPREQGAEPDGGLGSEPAPYGMVLGWFGLDDEIYAVHEEDTLDGTDVFFRRVKLADGKAVLETGSLPKPDNRELIEYDAVNDCKICNGLDVYFASGNYLAARTGSDGRMKLLVFDLTDGSCVDRDLQGYDDVFPGPGDSILIAHLESVRDRKNLTIVRLNPESGNEETAAELSDLKQDVTCPRVDPEREILYYVYSGKVWAMPLSDPDKAYQTGDFPSDNVLNGMVLPEGSFLAASNWFAAVYEMESPESSGTAHTDVTLSIRDFMRCDAVSRAAGEMNSRQEGIRTELQQENTYAEDLMTLMLKHDAQTDVYVMQYGLNEFRVLRDRGYVTDMSGNRQIAESTERMYPFVRDAVTREGKIIAVPVSADWNAVSIDLHAWEQAGGTEEELPRTWDQFFDWLETLPERLDGTETVVTNETGTEFRGKLIGVILESYQTWNESKGKDYSFNTPLLNGLLKRVDGLNYEALTAETGTQYTGALLTFDSFSPDRAAPLRLAFEEGEEPVIPVSLTAAFINPYSEHPEEAKAFLAQVLNSLDIQAQYILFADKTEPVERQGVREELEQNDEYIGLLRKQIEAADDENKPALEEMLRQAEKDRRTTEDNLWTVSPETISRYQEMLPAMTVQDHFFMRDLIGTSENEEAMALFLKIYYGEGDGTESLQEILASLDNQLRMKRLEGN